MLLYSYAWSQERYTVLRQPGALPLQALTSACRASLLPAGARARALALGGGGEGELRRARNKGPSRQGRKAALLLAPKNPVCIGTILDSCVQAKLAPLHALREAKKCWATATLPSSSAHLGS